MIKNKTHTDSGEYRPKVKTITLQMAEGGRRIENFPVMPGQTVREIAKKLSIDDDDEFSAQSGRKPLVKSKSMFDQVENNETIYYASVARVGL